MTYRRLLLSTALVAALGFAGSSCFGKFAATRALYGFNEGISGNKFIRSLVMWGLIIVPAYELFGLGDFLIFNTIEFWTGANVIGATGGDDASALAKVDVQVDADGRVTLQQGMRRFVLTPMDATHVRVEADGALLGVAELQPDQSMVLRDPHGSVVQTLLPADLQAVAENVDRLPVTL